jgi:hypothetical protein
MRSWLHLKSATIVEQRRKADNSRHDARLHGKRTLNTRG